MLFAKDLIFLNPEDRIPISNLVQSWTPCSGGERDPYYEVKGISTLEDIIELILGGEIVDKTDSLGDVAIRRRM